MKIRILIALAGMLLSAGCLVEETRHTLYLEPDGSVTWTVLESGVRSTAGDRREGRNEEQEFLSLAGAAEQPIARALDQLRPSELRSHLLRTERPFTVFNEAWYPSLEKLAEEILAQLEIDGRFELHSDGDLEGFVLTLHWTDSEESDGEEIENLMPIVTELADYKLVLPAGRFVEAIGFEIVDDGVGAVPVALIDGDTQEEAESVTYSLTWAVE